MQIGQLAKELSVSTKTLRHYEKIGMLPPATRSENGYRTYSPDAVRTARLIVMLRRLELSLEEIRNLLDDDPGRLRRKLMGILDEKRSILSIEVAVLQGKLEDLDTRYLRLVTTPDDSCKNCIADLFGENCMCA